jgi:hypothetical protein
MSRIKVNLPEAGKDLKVKITGVSVIVENCNTYSPEQVPTFSFDKGPADQPIYPRSQYPSEGGFNSITIQGTEQSAGDEITLLSTMDCLQLDLNISFDQSYRAGAGISFVKTADGTVRSLSDLEIEKDGVLPSKIYISARGNDAIFAFNANPVADGGTDLGTVLAAEGEAVPVEGIEFIRGLRFKEKITGSPAEVTIHLEY